MITDLLPPNATRADVRAALDGMSDAELKAITYDWRLWARPEQLLPAGEWRTWVLLGGRGSGKTRPGAEVVRGWARDPHAMIALVAPTAADARQVMIEGESGILAISPEEERPVYRPSIRELRWPSGARGYTYSAEEPERLRGPQHSCCWLDEVAAYPKPKVLWDLLLPGLRLGSDPRRVVTTTPKPSKFLAKLLADPTTVISRLKTRDNRVNLAPGVVEDLERVYGGTRIGRQELDGELLEEAEGALWRGAQIEALRVAAAPDLVRVCVAIDPSVSSGPNSDEVGIIVAGLGADGHGYILRDLSGRMSPDDWAQRAVAGFDHYHADKIIAEANNGGDLIISVMRTVRNNIPVEKVHAARGKITRAEPVAALTEQGKLHMVGGFPELEQEMTNYVAGESASPNRMDALVWAISYLMLRPAKVGRVLGL